MDHLKLTAHDFENRFLPGMKISEFKESIFRRRRQLFDSGNPEYYQELFGRGDLTSLLENTMLHRPSIRMVGKGQVLPMHEISYSIPYGVFSFENIVDIEKVRKWYQEGYTINVRGAHYNHSGLGHCTALLQEVFACNIELLSSLVFEACRSCGDLAGFGSFNSVFERNACDDFGEVVKAA